MMNTELDNYLGVTSERISAAAAKILAPANGNTLYYLAKKK